ncbi:tyrosine-protein phosphatase [Paracoccus sp. MBLB3053]|uniref:Tyrosine-protein phosphatase n=1 Tax=Paracoccus aurantius TaxID=3073814 RepID=A0ABU2HYL1_9RHOB|nr:tyrosine-protein phosphatase [Paracoccus sp. MBLB3053]MDS9470121.1 tyrosine-protein phosphatase [Paracoccus sp. MBLB3053]
MPKLTTTVSATALALALVQASAASADALDTVRLSSVDNFRDVAGTTTAYSTAKNGVMRSGVFYRSNALTLSDEDLATIETLGISDVYDLRTTSEIASTPDRMPRGASYTNVNIIGDIGTGFSLTSAEASRAMMEDAERSFVNDSDVQDRFATLFNGLASAEDAALFHCTAGKDRTGWTAAVLQGIAGVSDADIMADYLATNAYTADRVAETYAYYESHYGTAFAEAMEPLLGVEASFLQAGLDEVAANYGTMENYVTQGLGLSQETLYVLRGKMVRYALPGQEDLTGNAAAGARVLSDLQDSDLSGAYTNYNYYLQSAIDAGTLGGVETTVGGQVHADAASSLLREISLIDAAVPHASGRAMEDGQQQVWTKGLTFHEENDARPGIARSEGDVTGFMLGASKRFDSQMSGYVGAGTLNGSTSSAAGEVDTDQVFVTLGGRYGFESLDRGAFAAVNFTAAQFDYDSKRRIGGGLGTATGSTDGNLYGASLKLGYDYVTPAYRVTPTVGIRFSHLKRDAFTETGSELALDMDELSENRRDLLLGVEFEAAPTQLGKWSISPAVSAAYEHSLDDGATNSRGFIEGLPIDQVSAFDSRDIFRIGASVNAKIDQITISAEGTYQDENPGGLISVSYAF